MTSVFILTLVTCAHRQLSHRKRKTSPIEYETETTNRRVYAMYLACFTWKRSNGSNVRVNIEHHVNFNSISERVFRCGKLEKKEEERQRESESKLVFEWVRQTWTHSFYFVANKMVPFQKFYHPTIMLINNKFRIPRCVQQSYHFYHNISNEQNLRDRQKKSRHDKHNKDAWWLKSNVLWSLTFEWYEYDSPVGTFF